MAPPQSQPALTMRDLMKCLASEDYKTIVRTAVKPIVNEIVKDVKTNQQKLENQRKRITELEQKVRKQEAEIAEIKTKIGTKENELTDVRRKIDRSERNDKLLTLRVTGLPSKDTKQRFIQIAAERMESSLSDADFDVHVLAKQPVSGSSPPVLLRFTTLWMRNLIYYRRMKLNGLSIYISENLNKEEQNIFYICRQLKKEEKIKQTWTRNLKIYVRLNSHEILEVTSIAEAEALKRKQAAHVNSPLSRNTPVDEPATSGSAQSDDDVFLSTTDFGGFTEEDSTDAVKAHQRTMIKNPFLIEQIQAEEYPSTGLF